MEILDYFLWPKLKLEISKNKTSRNTKAIISFNNLEFDTTVMSFVHLLHVILLGKRCEESSKFNLRKIGRAHV